jgi:hypothetical protein
VEEGEDGAGGRKLRAQGIGKRLENIPPYSENKARKE